MIEIHGKKYITVAERVQALHADEYAKDASITTEVLFQNPVVIKATVTINGHIFTGISAANPDKAIEKMSPYEVAETSAVGRALGFAGYGIVDGIATADEVTKATVDPIMEVTKDEPTKSVSSYECPVCGAVAEFRTGKKANGQIWQGIFCTDPKCKNVKWLGAN